MISNLERNPCAAPDQSCSTWIGLLTMNSITKSSPAFNPKTGLISYAWDDIIKENPLCPKCGEIMLYWYSRKRNVIISDDKYIFMAPRFKCSCGKTLTMHPYFIVKRKQYSAFSIQEILNADISNDHMVTTSYGNSEVTNLRRWAVALVRGKTADCRKYSVQDERSCLNEFRHTLGDCWLASILRSMNDSAVFFVSVLMSG